MTPDVGDVGHPLQVPGDGVETDEEPGEQQNRDRCDRTDERRHLRETNTPEWSQQVNTPVCEVTQLSEDKDKLACREVEAAPISRPRL